MSRPIPIALRLTLLFAAASALVLAILGALLLQLVESHFVEQDVDDLNGKLVQIAKSIESVSTAAELEQLGSVLGDLLIGHEQFSLTVLDSRRRLLFSTTAVEFPAALRAPPNSAARTTRGPGVAWSSGGQHYRGVAVALPTGNAAFPPLTVAVAVNMAPHMVFLAQFKRSLVWSLVGSIALIALLSWLAARRGLAPIREIARLATNISAERLGDRLPMQGVPAEMVELAQAFNDMLDRLGDSFRRLREFSSDVAHELRTPVSNIMTQTQVVLSAERSAQDYREVLHSILEEHERLARMVGDMLYLSKAENGLMVPGDEVVDLAAESRSLSAFYEALVEELGVQLHVRGAGAVRGHRLMLRRAISNLLSNAIRHTARGNAVELSVDDSRADVVELSVRNPGPDIPPEHLPRLFDRFYQVDPSRSKSGEGAGLGLAIARSIALAHGASLRVASAHGSTCFVIAFPKSASSAAAAAAARTA